MVCIMQGGKSIFFFFYLIIFTNEDDLTKRCNMTKGVGAFLPPTLRTGQKETLKGAGLAGWIFG